MIKNAICKQVETRKDFKRRSSRSACLKCLDYKYCKTILDRIKHFYRRLILEINSELIEYFMINLYVSLLI